MRNDVVKLNFTQGHGFQPESQGTACQEHSTARSETSFLNSLPTGPFHSKFLAAQNSEGPSISPSPPATEDYNSAHAKIIPCRPPQAASPPQHMSNLVEELQKIKIAAEIRADVVSKRELQNFDISIHDSGELVYTKRLFHEDVKNAFPFRLRDACFFVSDLSDSNDIVLHVEFAKSKKSEQKNSLAVNLNLSSLSEAYVLRKFREQGLILPHHREKAAELLLSLVAFLCSLEFPIKKLPSTLGWRQEKNNLEYTIAKSDLWKEALDHAK